MSETIELELNVKTGELRIRSDREAFSEVVERASEILERFYGGEDNENLPEHPPVDEPTGSGDQPGPNGEDRKESKTKKRRRAGGGKTANLKLVDNLLTEPQRGELRALFGDKNPKTQNEQVAVITVFLKKTLGQDEFTVDEIYTGFQAVGKKTPANLKAVFGNMATEGLGSQVNGKFRPSFKSNDLVEHDLPSPTKAK